MDALDYFLYLGIFLLIVLTALRIVYVVRHIDQPLTQRPLWPWSITRYKGWNQSIPQHPVAEPFFPRPWAM
jgi:hypothetical protein